MKMDVDQTQMNGKKQNVEVEYIIDVSGGLGGNFYNSSIFSL